MARQHEVPMRKQYPMKPPVLPAHVMSKKGGPGAMTDKHLHCRLKLEMGAFGEVSVNRIIEEDLFESGMPGRAYQIFFALGKDKGLCAGDLQEAVAVVTRGAIALYGAVLLDIAACLLWNADQDVFAGMCTACRRYRLVSVSPTSARTRFTARLKGCDADMGECNFIHAFPVDDFRKFQTSMFEQHAPYHFPRGS